MPITLFGYTYLTCTTYLADGKAQIHWPLPLERVQQPDESAEKEQLRGGRLRIGSDEDGDNRKQTE